jgi:spore germination protein
MPYAPRLGAGRRAAAKISHRLNYEHLKVFVIHEELVRQGLLADLVDFYIRDHEMRRRTFVFVSKGEAQALLEQFVPLEDMPAMFLERLAENYPRVLQMPRTKEIGEISERLLGKRSYMIPRITVGENGKDHVLAGAAVIRGVDNKMIGWFGEYDIEGYNWVLGEAENGIVEVKTDHEDLGEEYIVFETDKVDTEVNYERKNGRNYFDVSIKADGFLVESWLHGVDISDEETLELLEAETKHKIEKQARDIMAKSQQEFHTDVFEFIIKIKHEEYDYYEKVREKWDGPEGEFQHADVSVSAVVNIEL